MAFKNVQMNECQFTLWHRLLSLPVEKLDIIGRHNCIKLLYAKHSTFSFNEIDPRLLAWVKHALAMFEYNLPRPVSQRIKLRNMIKENYLKIGKPCQFFFVFCLLTSEGQFKINPPPESTQTCCCCNTFSATA